jgi:hypothetical protein
MDENDFTLVPAFSEFLVPVVFTSFKPFLLREKKGSTHARYNKEIRFSVTVLYSDKNQFISPPFFCFFSFLPSANIKNFKKLNFLLIGACS